MRRWFEASSDSQLVYLGVHRGLRAAYETETETCGSMLEQ